jgi:CubicO group peptidase (beta-lactamase class C family)
LAVLGLLGVPASGAGAAKPSRADRVDAVFAEFDSRNTPGCSVGVGDRGRVLFAHGYGAAKLGGARLTPRSVFDLASVSKQITAAVVYLLVAEGKLALDDDIRTLVPGLPDYGVPVTLDDMLHHTSGLPDYVNILTEPETAHTTKADALDALSSRPELRFPPGSRFEYSNTNYFLLSVAAERTTGKSFRSLVTRRIFRPLSMRASIVRDDVSEPVRRAATGYVRSDERAPWQPSVTRWEQTGDGAVNSSVVDLLRWARNLSTFEVGGRQLRDEMLTPGPVLDQDGYGYGGGLSIYDDFGGRHVAEHSGGWAGYSTDLLVLPEEGLGVAVLCNRADVDPYNLAKRVMSIWLDGQDEG